MFAATPPRKLSQSSTPLSQEAKDLIHISVNHEFRNVYQRYEATPPRRTSQHEFDKHPLDLVMEDFIEDYASQIEVVTIETLEKRNK